ncbi:MAG: hypothetical protein FWC89_08780, partial [Defluviitaleaceae bacterium]|nr:hypothetical protein [Defluviitaleaceae bacterium]
GNCALHLLGINRVWNNQSIFTFVDAFKYREWQTITLTVTAYGQTHEVVFKNCECKDVVEPVVVDLGFIGYYFHPSRPESYGPMSTSFFWLTLEEGDIIDWDAVEAAYAGWVAQGGLAPDFATGWHSSGFAPITFNHGAAIGHGDFSFPQLEGFYRAYFVSPGFLLPAYVCSNVCEDCGRNNCATCNECVCVAKLPPVLPPVVPPCDGDDDCDDVIEGDNDDEDYDDGNEGDNDDEDYDNGNEGNKDDEDYDNGNNGDDDNNNDQGEDNDEQ